jgi:hypothetical protein
VPMSAGAVSASLPSLPSGAPQGPGLVTLRATGTGGNAVIVTGPKPMPRVLLKRLRESLAEGLPASMSAAQRAAVLQGLASAQQGATQSASVSVGSVTFSTNAVTEVLPAAAAPALLGKGWLSVAVLAGGGPPVPSVLPQGASPAGSLSGVLSALETAATPVHGSWGSGRLLRTSLLSFLMLSNGQVLVGAVTPAVLYADAAQLR